MLPTTAPSSVNPLHSIYTKPLPYYQDTHRNRTPEDAIETGLDLCESEGDGDTEKTKVPVNRGFFKRFAVPRTQIGEASGDQESLSEVRNRGPGIFTYLNKRVTGSPPPLSSHVDDEAEIYGKVLPVDVKSSIEVTPAKQGRKFTPSQFGIFSSSSAMLPATDPTNTAKDLMDDMLVDGETGDEAFAVAAKPQPTPGDETKTPSDNDVVENRAEHDDATDAVRQILKRRGRPPGATNEQVGYEGVDADSPLRRSSRREAALQSLKLASRSPAGIISKTTSKAGRKRGSIWSKPSLLGQSRPDKRVLHHQQKSGLRLRNHKGELIEDGKAIVVISDDEVVNVEEFVRWYE